MVPGSSANTRNERQKERRRISTRVVWKYLPEN
jgi:hypothetical protein